LKCILQVLRGLDLERLPERLRPAAARLGAAAHTEAAVAAHDVGRVAEAEAHLAAAEQLLGVRFEVTGEMRCCCCLDCTPTEATPEGR
jgi:hypothetical protein